MTDMDHLNPMPDEPVPTEEAPKEASTPTETPTEEAEPAPTEAPAEPTEKVIYRWAYAETPAPVPAPPRSKKLTVYAVVMTTVFLVSFALLIAVLWVGRYDPDNAVRPGVSGTHDDVAIDGVEQARHVVTTIEVMRDGVPYSGSGIILRRDGYIATNHHVIEGASTIKVTFYDGTYAVARLVGSSEADDLAVIKVDRGDLPEARFADYSQCYVGQTVYVIGAPGGPEFGWTTTRGIISYINREIKMYDDDGVTLLKKLRMVQIDASVNGGNSGGALINTAGEIVGVVSMKIEDEENTSRYEGIGFAIPADGAQEILWAIIEGRDFDSTVSHKRPMLGITCIEVKAGKYYIEDGSRLHEIPENQLSLYPDREIFHSTATGVMVMSVNDSMGAAGKLKRGDIITAVDAWPIETGEELSAYVNNFYVGDTITLTVVRDGREKEIKLVLTAQSDTD